VLSVPDFVLAYPHNYRFSFFLLETFNNLLQYQYEGNVPLALALIRNKEAMFRLVNLTVSEQEVTTKSEEEEGERWKPTKEWLDSWKSHLPSATVMALIRATEPALEVLEKVSGRVGNEEDALSFLQTATLVGLLPVPHPILIRQYHNNPATAVWFASHVWGQVYIHHLQPPIFADTKVALFRVIVNEPEAL
jgi:hypothetical protein